MSIPGMAKSYPYWPSLYDNGSGGGGGGGGNSQSLLATNVGTVQTTGSMRNADGHLVCDGEVFTQEAYPDLFLSIGQNYDGNPLGSFRNKNCLNYNSNTDFVVPAFNFVSGNTIPRFMVGADLTYWFNSNTLLVADLSGGASEVALDLSNIPMHQHEFSSYGGTQTTGLANGGFDPQTGTILQKTDCELYDCSGNLAQSGAPQPFSIIPNFLAFYTTIRANNPDPSSEVGYTTFTTANNKLYVALLRTDSNFPTPVVDDWSVFETTLPVGNFTRLQVLSNLANSIETAVNSQTSNTNIAVQNAFVGGYRIAPTGQCSYQLQIEYTHPLLGNNNYLQLLFNTVSNMPFQYVYPLGTTNIPQSVLDKCADTLGFFTRSANPALPNTYDSGYNVNSNYAAPSDIVPPKALKINWDGSIQGGQFTPTQFNFLSNY